MSKNGNKIAANTYEVFQTFYLARNSLQENVLFFYIKLMLKLRTELVTWTKHLEDMKEINTYKILFG
jgi:hypothetical protein